MPTPEQVARQAIDEMLTAAGWLVQDYKEVNPGAGRGIAVREFPLKTGAADYLLIVDRKAIGAVEAKAEGTPLSGVEPQNEKYSIGLPDNLRAWCRPLPFLYESSGVETYVTNGLDPEPRSRRLFTFHRPETLADWAAAPSTLRARLRIMPPLLTANLWAVQIEAITNLERSLAEDRPRALIQMATGSGKTYTAVGFLYRLIKHAGASRVLFLVDRANLGRQALREFQTYATPDDGRKFTELYNVQRLTSNAIDPVNKVVITTIQRLYSILCGEESFDEANEEQSLFEVGETLPAVPRTVRYNPRLPIEFFDFVVIDECHRSIYNLWRQPLEYFDAYLIGLTATPYKQTFGFFNQNLVMEYTRPRAVADGVNVDGQVYRIRTVMTDHGSTVEAGEWVGKRDRKTRKERWEELDEDLTYAATQLDRDVVAPSQIRTVIRTFKEKLFTEIFPGRSEVPKTLIFAKDDDHAENIVRIVREEFAKPNEFCQKITYRVTGVKTDDLIATFRNSYNPRIAVTVDMIATGTDIKPLEILLFMRLVNSRGLFEQMLGRGTRVISPTDLQAVTPDAAAKTHFVIVDAVGIVEHPKAETQTLDRKRSVPFEHLMRQVILGSYDDDTLNSLAGRLARLERTLTPNDEYDIAAVSGGCTLRELANALLDAVDPDKHAEEACAATGLDDPSPADIATAKERLTERAVTPFDNPELRKLLVAIQSRNEQTIDTVSIDRIKEAGFSQEDTERARAVVTSFREFVEQHRDEITALQIIFSRPYAQRHLTYDAIKDLARHLEQPPLGCTPETLWQAYAQIERDRVRGAGAKRVLADLISLVRHAVQPDSELIPFPETVRARYENWLEAQERSGHRFSLDQRWWLDRIAEFIGVNLAVTPDDLNAGEFYARGGRLAAVRIFGPELPAILEELNSVLAA